MREEFPYESRKAFVNAMQLAVVGCEVSESG